MTDKRPDLRLVTTDTPADEKEINHALAALHEYANIIADDFGDDLAGFALVAIDNTGRTSGGYVLTHEAPFELRVLPAVVHDVVHQQVLEREITEAIERLN